MTARSVTETNREDLERGVRMWLWTVYVLIFVMVVVGGITRLTGSGLSMVEWQPLIGAIPPLSDAAWQEVFTRYRATPQYAQVNHWMDLTDFQRIFFWEYLHRLLGRSLGVVFLLPFLYFVARRRLRGAAIGLSLIAFVLGGAQGVLGWYMVKSGLVDVPAVSHYRLAAHLMLAFLTAMYVAWLALALRKPRSEAARERTSLGFRLALSASIALTLLQIVYGAFMAGKHAGLVASTFPDMNGAYLPAPFFRSASVIEDLLSTPAAIHWMHRFLGFLLLIDIVALVGLARREPLSVRRATAWTVASILLQLVLGAAVVVLEVPIWLAVVHQAGAFVVLTAMTFLSYESGLLPSRIGGRAAMTKERGAAMVRATSTDDRVN